MAWLGAVDGGVPCARVVGYDDTRLTLGRIHSAPPTRESARQFGVRLAVTHDAGATAFGAAPDGWTGPGFFGPLTQPLSMSFTAHRSWGEFYAAERLSPMAERAAQRLTADGRPVLAGVVRRCASGDFDTDDEPARLHGDLWSGNVMWTVDGAVLIDPAAHGGHRETDLAMLALFGCPHLADVLDGSSRCAAAGTGLATARRTAPALPAARARRVFGGGYARQAVAAAASALRR